MESLQIPTTVQTILAARIDRLSADEKQLLQAAAVIDKNAPHELLAAIAEVPETWSLDYLSVSSGNQTVPTATVRLKNSARKKTEAQQDASIGDGPVDAALKAMDRITKTRGKLMDYQLRAVSEGKDALGEVTVKVAFGDSDLITGKGASTDGSV